MDFRHEWKYEINASDMIAVRQRLRAAARPDPHAVEGKYLIRSLYFDNLADKALLEKLDGVNQREKFRIRLLQWRCFSHSSGKEKQAEWPWK